jgi:hypothetical protein
MSVRLPIPEMLKVLERIQSAGLKCVPEFPIKDSTAKSLESLRTMMEMSKDSPAIIAWCVLDEPEFTKDFEATTKEIYTVAKAIDSYRPVYINHTTHQKFNRDVVGDISSVDIYPVPDQDFRVFPELIEQMKVPGKPVWIDLQSTGNAYMYYREPTVDEFHFMTLSCLLKGASGVFYFSNLPHSASLRKNMPELFGMIGKYAPIFLSPPVAGSADAGRTGPLILSWRICDGKTYLLALNTSAVPFSGDIDTRIIPGVKSAWNLRDHSVVPLHDGKLHDPFAAFAFKIYQVEQ